MPQILPLSLSFGVSGSQTARCPFVANSLAQAAGRMPSFVIKTKIKVERSLATNSGSAEASVSVWDSAVWPSEQREVASAIVRLDPDDKNVEIRKADPSEGLVAAVDWNSARGDFEFTLTAGVRRPFSGLPLSTVAVELEVQANGAIIDEASRRSGAGSRSTEVEYLPAS